jgi:outer membrane protein
MKTVVRRLLIALLISALSASAMAAETIPASDQKPATPSQPAQQAQQTIQKTPEPLAPQPPSAPLSNVEPQKAPSAPATPPATPPPYIVNPQPASQISIPKPVGVPAAAGSLQGAPESLKAQSAVLVGLVDIFRVSAESDPGKAGQSKLAEKKKKLQSQAEAKRKQLDKLKESIEAQISTLPPGQREAKSKEFRKKVEEFQKFGQNAENELQKLQQELSRTLYEKIEKAATEYAKSNNLSLVIVKRDLLFQSGGVIPMDVTEGIVKLINENKNDKKNEKKK